LALKGALHAGGKRLPPCKTLPLLLEVHLGNSLLAGGLLQLQAPSMQRLGEFIELLPADLDSLATSLELGSLGRKADLLLGNSLLPLLQGFLPSRRRELPAEHLLKPFSVGLKVRKLDLDKLSLSLHQWCQELQETASQQAVAEMELEGERKSLARRESLTTSMEQALARQRECLKKLKESAAQKEASL